MARITDCKGEWFELWCECRESVIATMASNMASDLACGYDYFGKSITAQKDAIESYKREYDATMDMFKGMTETEVDRWCFYDMKKRGDID